MEGTGNYGEIKREQSSMTMPPSSSKPPLPLPSPSSSSPFRLLLKPHSLTINCNPSAALDNKPDLKSHSLTTVNDNPSTALNNKPNLPHKNNASETAFHEDDDSKIIIYQQPPQDPRKLKRVVSNRVSAQRSRMRKLQHVSSLEKQSRILENQIAFLQPQIQAYTNEKQLLLLEKRVLTQKLAALDKERIVKEAEIEFHQTEIQMLRELEKQQKQELKNQAMMANYNWNNTLLNNQFVPEPIVYPKFSIEVGGLENTKGTSSRTGMEVNDEQNEMNFNMNNDPMNELEAIVNPWIMKRNKDSNSESGHCV